MLPDLNRAMISLPVVLRMKFTSLLISRFGAANRKNHIFSFSKPNVNTKCLIKLRSEKTKDLKNTTKIPPKSLLEISKS